MTKRDEAAKFAAERLRVYHVSRDTYLPDIKDRWADYLTAREVLAGFYVASLTDHTNVEDWMNAQILFWV